MSDETLTDDEKTQLVQQVAYLKQNHRRIDDEIVALRELGVMDMLKIGRMKKIKLKLKDEITQLENHLTPDIIA